MVNEPEGKPAKGKLTRTMSIRRLRHDIDTRHLAPKEILAWTALYEWMIQKHPDAGTICAK